MQIGPFPSPFHLPDFVSRPTHSPRWRGATAVIAVTSRNDFPRFLRLIGDWASAAPVLIVGGCCPWRRQRLSESRLGVPRPHFAPHHENPRPTGRGEC
jgi:hypothetical protein